MKTFFAFVMMTGVYLMLFGIALLLTPNAQQYFYPLVNVFEVRSIIVRDAAEGTDPDVEIDRIVKRPFTAQRSVEIDLILEDKRYLVCEYFGLRNYDPADVATSVKLSWYVGKKCPLAPGKYMMTTTWIIDYGLPFPAKLIYVSPRFNIGQPTP